jgi:rhodanese-related sulfurtransferase
VKPETPNFLDKPETFCTSCLRAAGVVLFSCVLGLATNHFAAYPVPLLAADGPGALPERAERIGVDEFKKLTASRKAVLLLDVRRDEAFNAGHAAGSLHAAMDDFAAQYESQNLDQKLQAADVVVLICESDDCPSADRAARLLKDLQYPDVRVFYGGWSAYAGAGFPVDTATGAQEQRKN